MKTQLKQNEEVVVIIRKHWLVLLKPILWLLIFLIVPAAAYYFNFEFWDVLLIGAGISLIVLIYKVFERKNNLWAVTNLRVIDEYGVFSNNAKETPLDKINNVSYRQPLIGRLFNYGDVQIQSAAEAGATLHKMVEKPEILKDVITQWQERYKQEQFKEQAKNYIGATNIQQSRSIIDAAEELTRLHELMGKGIITEEEFQKMKEKIING